jgi:hypothetical protein
MNYNEEGAYSIIFPNKKGETGVPNFTFFVVLQKEFPENLFVITAQTMVANFDEFDLLD